MASRGTNVSYRRLIAATATILVVWIFMARMAAGALIVEKPLTNAELIVVLAGSSTQKERVGHAAELIKQGRAPKILLTNDGQRGGWSQATQTNPYHVVVASEELQRLGVRSDQIEIVSPESSGTYQEALMVRSYAASHNVRSILIVTSAYHSRRALWTFDKVFSRSGVQLGIDAASPGQQTPGPLSWWLHLQGWRIVPVEYVKMLYYWLRF